MAVSSYVEGDIVKAKVLMCLIGALSIVSAGPGTNSVFWCHYPAGQWTGDPATSKLLILSIDPSAEASHLAHSPLLQNNLAAEGVTLTGAADGCPNGTCGTALFWDHVAMVTVNLVAGPTPGICVCPSNTPDHGSEPAEKGTVYANCGGIF